MSNCLRYQQPQVVQHLAQQYCLGLLTARTHQRMERLIEQHKELAIAVGQWQMHLSKIVDSLAEQPAPKSVWNNLNQQLKIETHVDQTKPWFDLSSLWWPLFGSGCALLLCLSLFVQWQQSPLIESSASYLALMQHSDTQQERFVLSAYQGIKPGQSQLKIQWLQAQAKDDLTALTLWSTDRESGERRAIGQLSQLLNSKGLSKSSWLLIKQSASLQLVKNNQIVYSGLCLQLKPWLQHET